MIVAEIELFDSPCLPIIKQKISSIVVSPSLTNRFIININYNPVMNTWVSLRKLM